MCLLEKVPGAKPDRTGKEKSISELSQSAVQNRDPPMLLSDPGSLSLDKQSAWLTVPQKVITKNDGRYQTLSSFFM